MIQSRIITHESDVNLIAFDGLGPFFEPPSTSI